MRAPLATPTVTTTTMTISISHGSEPPFAAALSCLPSPPRGEPKGATHDAPTSTPALLRMLQLSSSLCPIGAFAYSQGLETAVELGWVSSEGDLEAWLLGLGAHALAKLDLPLLLRAHEAAQAADHAGLLRIAERVLCSREAREFADQERQLGSSLASVLVNLGASAAEPFRGHASASYVVSFALGAVHFGLDTELAMTGYCYAWCEQQVSAAARLVPLGHMAAQRALSRVLTRVPDWLEQARGLSDDQMGSSTPGLAMSLAWHETQYTRLFRS
jgi:urease accessory protein